MAKINDTGIYKNDNGTWYYRIKLMEDANGNKIDTTCKRDENKQPFKTKTSCKRARDRKLVELQTIGEKPKENFPDTLEDIWKLYLKNHTADKADSTVVKHKSVWKNHIKEIYGKQKLKSLKVSELHHFLAEKYAIGYKYSYVESILKTIYLLYGVAYRENKIDAEQYNRAVIDKGTRLKMPKERREKSEEEVRILYKHEINKIFAVVKGTNLETAFMLGYYTGMRVSEVFGLQWKDVDFSKGIIKVTQQLYYNNKIFCTQPLKTMHSYRDIVMPTILQKHLSDKLLKQKEQKKQINYRNTERILDKTKNKFGVEVIGENFVNRKENGTLLTGNSLKYYMKKIKNETGIKDFKFHSLRKTHLSELAAMNTPIVEVMRRAGHSKIETTQEYYLACNEDSRKILLENINKITTKEPEIEVNTSYGQNNVIKESDYLRFLEVSKNIPHVNDNVVTYGNFNDHPKVAI